MKLRRSVCKCVKIKSTTKTIIHLNSGGYTYHCILVDIITHGIYICTYTYVCYCVKVKSEAEILKCDTIRINRNIYKN